MNNEVLVLLPCFYICYSEREFREKKTYLFVDRQVFFIIAFFLIHVS